MIAADAAPSAQMHYLFACIVATAIMSGRGHLPRPVTVPADQDHPLRLGHRDHVDPGRRLQNEEVVLRPGAGRTSPVGSEAEDPAGAVAAAGDEGAMISAS